ncbi:MAG: UvrD-helicase domain-containing protein [Burkholderiales bacterium]|nr:UvrD-helicase domain-containing protein [Burkholderiales bacterium]
MTGVSDQAARLRALTDLEATLLVEAAAGTGKTALIAGRLTMLLASGSAPSSLAAITFTEAAASELSDRVHRYVDTLLEGGLPTPIKAALPSGLTAQQLAQLSQARGRLEELTATTIHGFCQKLIQSYAVEADVDPGAQVLDETHAKIAFDRVFDQWLRRRLTTTAGSDDPIALLSKEDPTRVVSTLRRLATFRRDHRSARAIAPDLSGRPDVELVAAVDAFRAWHTCVDAEPRTAALLGDFEVLASFYQDTFKTTPTFASLWALGHPPRVPSMRDESYDFRLPQLKGAWRQVAGEAEGDRLHDEALSHITRVHACFRALLGKVATALVWTLSSELDEVLEAYSQFKRSAAVLDFDDLLYGARDLVKGHENVRIALSQRFSRILVDEFQDTDPIQAEILFRIAAVDFADRWEDSTLRSGALFMVADPKQAIYRFRGADIECYERARRAVRNQHAEGVLRVTSSFRSLPEILAHVNRCFETQLSAPGQPGYVPLTSTRREAPRALPCVAKRTIKLPPSPRVNDVRDAEAREVAEICARLIGNMEVVLDDGARRPLLPADIALLAPAGTQLQRYEHALDEIGLPYASQAGKSLFERQEIQDLVSLARSLADPFDTLALGALLRGPLIGLTEEELLDITAALPANADRPSLAPRLSLFTDPESVSHPLAKEALIALRALWRRSATTTPMLLLSDAIERLRVRALLAVREGERSSRALANVDVFLETARAYDVRGLQQFVRDVSRDWAQREARAEGRVESTGDAIEIVTIHSSKGLEWPVVILINTVTQFPSRVQFVHRPSDDTLHWVLGDAVPPDLSAALEKDEESSARERERLFYVAFTRARDLLVLPKLPSGSAKSWNTIMQDPFQGLSELDVSALPVKGLPETRTGSNEQTAELFAEQQRSIAAGIRNISWLRPSQDDLDRVPTSELLISEHDPIEAQVATGGGRMRGLILHKLIEEVLTRELADDLQALGSRAGELISQFGTNVAQVSMPDPDELANTVARTLALPEIVQLRPGLLAEIAVYSTLGGAEPVSLSGRADALYVEDGQPKVVVDWKSDVRPKAADIELHAAQLRVYMRATLAERGALVYISTGQVHWLARE